MGQQIEQFLGKYMTYEKYFQGIFESLNLKKKKKNIYICLNLIHKMNLAQFQTETERNL